MLVLWHACHGQMRQGYRLRLCDTWLDRLKTFEFEVRQCRERGYWLKTN